MKKLLASVCAVILILTAAAFAESVLTLPPAMDIIGERAFYGSVSLGRVELPEGVTEIRSQAFANSSLTEINLPASLTVIADDAFAGVADLTVTASEGTYAYEWAVNKGYIAQHETFNEDFTYNILSDTECEIAGYTGSETAFVLPRFSPDGYRVTGIGDHAFAYNDSLTSVTIPNGVTRIGNAAFCGCGSLTGVNIPNGVTSIGDEAFWGCTNITGIEIPANVTNIGGLAFWGCTNAVLTADGDNQYYSSLNGALYDKAMTTLLAWPAATGNVEIPDGVTGIAGSAFAYCEGLAGIGIPASVTNIGDSAFNSCSSLTNIAIPSGVTEIGYGTFQGCSSLTSITIPSGVTGIGDYAFQGCGSLTGIEIPGDVTSIGQGAFEGCSDAVISVDEDNRIIPA